MEQFNDRWLAGQGSVFWGYPRVPHHTGLEPLYANAEDDHGLTVQLDLLLDDLPNRLLHQLSLSVPDIWRDQKHQLGNRLASRSTQWCPREGSAHARKSTSPTPSPAASTPMSRTLASPMNG